MKHLVSTLLILLSLAFINPLQAQSCFEQGTFTISPGIGLGYYGYYGGVGGFNGRAIPILLSAEYSFTDLISGGLFVGRTSYNYTTYRQDFLNFGVRGSFHFTTLIEKWANIDLLSDKLDIYASAMAGYEAANVTLKDGGTGPAVGNIFDNRPVAGLVVGARWYFLPILGAFVEAGRGSLGLAAAGLTLKF